LGGIGVGADLDVGQHVVGAVICVDVRQCAVAGIRGNQQPVEVVVDVGPVVSGDVGAGHTTDTAGGHTAVGQVLQDRRALGGDDAVQPAAGGIVGVGGGDAVGTRSGRPSDLARA
jgi:hypothetical protein